ncbi:MAG: carbon-nitrogen hydrolase family protein [Candidatus Bathyarchaeota archaeon]|nr:MAG: carbon-nitrogen hydrolase family protein [Candidatus Bathyarchaeota archaeon]
MLTFQIFNSSSRYRKREVYILKLKIALAQTTDSRTSSRKQDNLNKALEWMKEAAIIGAQIIVFPEYFMGKGASEDVDGPFISSISKKARDLGISVIAGIGEKSGLPNKYYNTIVFINADGSIIGTYRKTHLFNAFNVKESNKVLAGDKLPHPINTEFGKISIITCYEIRFPEISRILTQMGTVILVVPSAWKKGLMKEEHWLTLVKARALENTIFVVAVGQTGNEYTGRSVVVDPFGVVIADAGEEEKLLFVEIDLKRIKDVRTKLPVLDHRREDLYTVHS